MERFRKILDDQQSQHPRVVDLNILFNVLIGIVEIQNRLMVSANWVHGYFIKARLLNVRRTVAFLDINSVLDNFENHGIPVCLKNHVTTPPGTDPTTFSEVGRFEYVDNEIGRIVHQGLTIFDFIARAYGLPTWADKQRDGSGTVYIEELVSAGRRTIRPRHV